MLEKMGEAYFSMGDNESAAESFAAALPLLKKSGELLYTAPALFCNSASVLAAEGMYEEALKWLEHNINHGMINYPLLNELDPFLENIRGEERFKKLMARIKTEWENFEV